MKRLSTAPVITAAVAVLVVGATAGCGDDEKGASGSSTDRGFARAMVPHHEAAVEMAALAEEKGAHRELRSLAADIAAAQTAEIRTMRRVDRELANDGVRKGRLNLDEHMMGMDHDPDALRSARAFDRSFLDMMVPHHRGAIRMARIELRRGKNGELRRLAGDIIEGQAREIRQMRRWRQSWYGRSRASDSPTDGHSGGHMMGH